MSAHDSRQAIRKTLRAEQAALRALSGAVDDSFLAAVDTLAGSQGSILVTGLGKSSYVAMKMAASLVSFGVRAQFLNAVEAMHGDSGVVEEGSVLVAFSYSGETAEVVRIVRYVKGKMSAKVIAITGKSRSTLAKLADHHIALTITDEGSPENVAPMASVTASLAVADMLTSGLLSKSSFDPRKFAHYHPGGSLGLKLRRVAEVMQRDAQVPIVAEDAPFREALTVMSAKHKGATGIVGVTGARGALVGVVTDGDVRRFMAHGIPSGTTRIKELMTKRPKLINEDASLAEALHLMETHRITGLFVVDGKRRPVGLLHIHHILEHSFS